MVTDGVTDEKQFSMFEGVTIRKKFGFLVTDGDGWVTDGDGWVTDGDG